MPKIQLYTDETEANKINARLFGYNKALSEFGIKSDPNLIQEFEVIEPKHIYDSTLAIIKRNPDMTALMVSDDPCAFFAASAIQSLGLNIPDDISITGFDNIRESAYANIPLTTMAQPIDELVNKTIELLLERISKSTDKAFKSYSFAPKLVIRNSTAVNTKSQ